MRDRSPPPWTSGPAEVLRHGLDLLVEDSDTNRRLAMIAIDNGVELAIKTYLGLPRRVTGIKLSRKAFREISESFPALLDALDEHATAKLSGIDLGEIEWYHRLRNQLYHDGNGLTVERQKVEVYAELANLLFSRLFDVPPLASEKATDLRLGGFLERWVELEKRLISFSEFLADTYGRTPGVVDAARVLFEENRMKPEQVNRVATLAKLRNRVVHGEVNPAEEITDDVIKELDRLIDWVKAEDPHGRGGARAGA